LFSSANKAKAFLHAEIQQRVQVPLEGDTIDARPFYFDRLYFEENSGLYFLAHFNDNTIRQQVLHVLTILGTQGIGTDRTVGNGLFNFDAAIHVTPFDLPGRKGGQLHMNLGLYLPSLEELAMVNMDLSYWQLVKRGGYMGGSSYEKFLSLRKNNIYFFGEGSVFRTDAIPHGRYINLKPDFNDNDLHSVYRCGQALFITI
jgi:CRISPR type III-A-associated RAMP protein Csm4